VYLQTSVGQNKQMNKEINFYQGSSNVSGEKTTPK